MHRWGETDFDWKSLYEAVEEFSRINAVYGRTNMHPKEKFGMLRDQHMGWWDGTVVSLLYPGYVYIPSYLQWFYFNIDTRIISTLMIYSGIQYLFVKYQKVVYNYSIQKLCKVYPHLESELVADLYYMDCIRPGIFGKVDGRLIKHKIYTRGE